MFIKITKNFYHLTDVFDKSFFDELVKQFDQDRSRWTQVADANTDVKRQQLGLSVNDSLGQMINQQLQKYVRIAEPDVGQLYQNGPQLWYDNHGYINTVHDGDVSPNHCVNIQIYLSNGEQNMGTCCYDEGEWHSVPYQANSGYMLISPTTIPHGMQHAVTDYRMSLYQGFRNTAIPSDIW